MVAEALQLPGAVDPQSTLVTLGSTSMQAIALQYQILQRTGTDLAIDDLLGMLTVAEIAELIAKNAPALDTAPKEAAQEDEVIV